VKGDFTVYLSGKIEKPNSEHGYEVKVEHKQEVEYPQHSSHILPGTSRFDHKKTVFITLETTQPCNILIETFQNFKDGRIPKRTGPTGPKKPSFKKDEDGRESKLHNTPGALMTLRALLKVPEKPSELKKLTKMLAEAAPARVKPAEATKLYNEKIASIIEDEKNTQAFYKEHDRIKLEKKIGKGNFWA